MTDEQHRIVARANRLQRTGRAGDSIVLCILSSEAPTMRYGPVVEHGPEDLK